MIDTPTINHQLPPTAQPLVVVVGETASGKSSLALEIAKRFDGELIGADSWTVYKDFNIGTAKPSAEEMRALPHHMFDIADPHDGFNAALFKEKAVAVIDEVQSRGKMPILVGGTGLYIDSVLFDYAFMPPGSPDERDRRNTMSITELLEEARSSDISLEAVDIRNKRRIIRALETGGQQAERKPLRSNTLVFGISTSREDLLERVTGRVDTMIEAGLEDEVKQLVAMYGWDVEPMKGIGYAEWHDYFFGSRTVDQTRQRIISDTMKLAKRQRTWFKRNNSIQWVSNGSEVMDILTTYLNKNR